MRPAPDERLICRWQPKVEQTLQSFEEFRHSFKAKIYRSRTAGYKPDSTVFLHSVNLQIYATNCPYLVRPGDKISLEGSVYLVQSVTLDDAALGALNSSRLSLSYRQRVCPKIIELV